MRMANNTMERLFNETNGAGQCAYLCMPCDLPLRHTLSLASSLIALVCVADVSKRADAAFPASPRLLITAQEKLFSVPRALLNPRSLAAANETAMHARQQAAWAALMLARDTDAWQEAQVCQTLRDLLASGLSAVSGCHSTLSRSLSCRVCSFSELHAQPGLREAAAAVADGQRGAEQARPRDPCAAQGSKLQFAFSVLPSACKQRRRSRVSPS